MNTLTYEKLQYQQLKEKVRYFCSSTLGEDLLEKLTPSPNLKAVENRLQETGEACSLVGAAGNPPLIGIDRINIIVDSLPKGEVLDPANLMQVYDFLRGCRKTKEYMTSNTFYAPLLASYAGGLTEFKDIEKELGRSIKGNQVDSGASKNLGRIRNQIEKIEGKINERLKSFLNKSENKEYLQDSFISKRGDYYTVPIKASYKNQVAGTVIEISTKGSTVFMEPNSISKLSNELIMRKAEESMEEYQILATLTGMILDNFQLINQNKDLMAKYDLIFAKARYSLSIHGIRPKLNDYGYIRLARAYHPLLSGELVPLDFEIGKNFRGLVITGPNAGGKTIVLKTIGLLTLATMSGIFIQADSNTEIAVYENIFVDIGDDQSIENALSTFSSHIHNIANIMRRANNNTLLLFDEIGSGTEPNEGAGLAISILEEFYQMGCISISTTHYGEIKRFSELHPDFKNAAMQFNPETLDPTYKLLIGESGESNALWISKKMNLRASVIERAKRYMRDKDYEMKLVREEKVRRQTQTSAISLDTVIYKKGDRVYLLDHGDFGLVYEEEDKYRNIIVFFQGDFMELNVRRIKMDMPATELYPRDYDMDQLFRDFKTRKLERDIKRGSKKALKKIQREMKNQG